MADDTAKPSAIPDDRKCGKCKRRISFVESTIKCRCGLAFCERHMTAENHDCAFDWRQMQREKIARENPQVVRSSSSVTSKADWFSQYSKHHSLEGRSQRMCQGLHAVGFLALAIATVRGLLLVLLRGRVIFFPQQLVLGYLLGLACAWLAPLCFGLPASGCRYCIFSWEVLSKPHWCLHAEMEQLKEHLMFACSAGKTNCLTGRLYNGPRTLSHIFRTVSSRLRELSAGKGCA
eukprot:TRINITY_DN94470_c0_g1_i1.p1 TRINITY_DN94470_c0_g1~~TRINITY_DN94470_c0_g1_i1.p1  ORF type:complete len:234 (+),score=26.95 TRINITY_DN94470_c0_g1_i1:54-755(+)